MSKKLDVLFVIPTNVPDFVNSRVKDAIEPPAKARFMAAYMMRRNRSVDLIDSNVTDYTPEKMAEEVVAANPRLVVIPVYGFNPSSSTQTMPSARLFAKAIKDVSRNTPIMFSGTHPAGIPAKTLQDEPIDYVCGGEGPITVYELVQALEAGGSYEDLKKVRSLWHWADRVGGSSVIKNASAPLVDLNVETALPGWKFMDPRKYRAHHWQAFYRGWEDRGPYANPYSREGCPFSCGFCNIQTTYREGEEHLASIGKLKPETNSFRALRPELFFEEVEYLVEQFGVKYFKIPDEMFGLGSHPVKIFTLIKERFGDSLNFWAYFRVDTLKPKDLELFRAGGLRWTPVGIEAANSDVRSGQDKKFSDAHIYKLIKQLNGAGISVALNYIFGLPGDTMETMQETYKMAVELNGPYGNFYCNQALPMSPQYAEAKAKGYPLPERAGGPGWAGHSQYGFECEPFYMGDAITPAQILEFRDKAHLDYYTRPEYRTMMLADPNFGQEAMESVNEWMKDIRSLKRKLLGHPQS